MNLRMEPNGTITPIFNVRERKIIPQAAAIAEQLAFHWRNGEVGAMARTAADFFNVLTLDDPNQRMKKAPTAAEAEADDDNG